MADDTTRGVHLNEKQLVFVLMAALVAGGVMFLFGVLVGRGVQASRGSVVDGSMVSAPQVVPDPQPPADAAGATPAGSQFSDLSYAKRLQQSEAPVEPLKAQAGSPPAGAPSTAGASAGATVSGDLPQPPPDVPPDNSPASGRAGVADGRSFTVQVTVVPKRADAELVVKRLKARGYDARVAAAEPTDKIRGFRVRIGSYKTRSDAEAVARKLDIEGPYKTWVTR